MKLLGFIVVLTFLLAACGGNVSIIDMPSATTLPSPALPTMSPAVAITAIPSLALAAPSSAPETVVASTPPSPTPTLTASPTPAASPSAIRPLQTLAISVKVGDFEQIFLIKSDSTGLTQLTDDPTDHLVTGWSPDGRRIFLVTGDPKEVFADKIWSMDADGSHEVNLTPKGALDQCPSWSPDGTRIVFLSNRDHIANQSPGGSDIYVMNADGSHVTRISNGRGQFFCPVWSSDGSRIAFAARQQGESDIYEANVDGTSSKLLIRNAYGPNWSPDGTKIAFVRDVITTDVLSMTDTAVWIADVDGQHERQVGQQALKSASSPMWSPDGAQISLRGVKDIQDTTSVYIFHMNDLSLVRITQGASLYINERWSPDGKQMLIEGDAGQLYIIDADGSNMRRLTGQYVVGGAWQP